MLPRQGQELLTADKPSANQSTFAVARRLLTEQGRKHAFGYCVAFVFMALSAGATAAAAWMMSEVVNRVFVDRNATALWAVALSLIVIYFVKGFSSYAEDVTLARIGNRIVASIQMTLFRHSLQQVLRV